jgi:hypothetical protein
MLDLMPGGYYYLASPYSSDTKAQETVRYGEAMRYAEGLLRQDILVFSPIVHYHPMSRIYGLPGDAASWQRRNKVYLRQSSGVIVACIPGWDKSKGVAWEIEYAQKYVMPLYKATTEHGRIYLSRF